MALVNRTFMLDITPGAIPRVVKVSEYDVNRAYTVTLVDEGGVFEIPSGTTAKVEGSIGGNAFSETATVSGNSITFTLTESMTAKAGDVWCKIKLTKDSKPIQTAAFILRCDRAGVEADTVIGAPGFEEQIIYGVDAWMDEHGGGVSPNARNLLKYVLEHAAYTATGMQTYINALDAALAGGGGDTTSHTITNALSHVTNSNSSTSVRNGRSYSATLSPASGYTLDSVTVTMGGVDVTSAVYSGGVITISSVTGNVVITASAVISTTYTIGTDLLVAKAGASVVSGSTGLKLDNYNSHTGRRTLYHTSGAKPFMNGTTGNEISGVYPIPVPATATSLTVTVDVSLEVTIKFWKYENGDYTLYQDGSWLSMNNNSATVNFTASANLYASVAFRVSSSGTFDNAHEISSGNVVLRG